MDVYIYSIIITVILILVISVLLVKTMQHTEAYIGTGEAMSKMDYIPKKIWTYWDTKNSAIPETVHKCIKTWRKYNEKYEITILNDETVKELCDIDIATLNIDKKFIARKADFVRLIIIEKYGGIWMDSSIICTQSLDYLFKKFNLDLVGFKSPHSTNEKYPIIENWFFAAPPKSRVVVAWLEESMYMTTFPSEQDYLNTLTDIDLQTLKFHLPYLTMHATLAAVIQRGPVYNLQVYPSITENGPFQYLHDVNWDTKKAVENLCMGRVIQPLIKLRGSERNYIISNNINCGILLQ